MSKHATETIGESSRYMLLAAEKQRDRKFGVGHPLYQTWVDMKRRCQDPRRDAYKNYGGRGITVCPAWDSSFRQFCLDMGSRPKGHTLERKDNDGPYSPENCVWATTKQQNDNKRTRSPHVLIEFDGETKPMGEWSRLMGVALGTLWTRYYRHGTISKYP